MARTSWCEPWEERRLMIALKDLVVVGVTISVGGFRGLKKEGFSLFITHARKLNLLEDIQFQVSLSDRTRSKPDRLSSISAYKLAFSSQCP